MDISVLRYCTLPIARELEQLPLPRLQHKLQKSCNMGAGSQREIIAILALLTPNFWCPRNEARPSIDLMSAGNKAQKICSARSQGDRREGRELVK